jgi:hypothetical protein
VAKHPKHEEDELDAIFDRLIPTMFTREEHANFKNLSVDERLEVLAQRAEEIKDEGNLPQSFIDLVNWMKKQQAH